MTMNKKTVGNALLITGCLLILAGALWYAYNLNESNRAYEFGVVQVAKIKEQIAVRQNQQDENVPEETVPASGTVENEEVPAEELPVVYIDNYPCCGYISIPAIELEMPVMDTADDYNLYYSVCRYEGTPYMQNLIIAGHNYRSVFQKLRDLKAGDEVFFTDMNGVVFRYVVLESVVIPGSGISEMEQGEWDLSLFTCTYGGADRYTVRCVEE